MQTKKAGLYSLLADQTKDCSKREQMAIVLRYVDIEIGSILERFLTYVKVVSIYALGLSTYILDTLETLWIGSNLYSVSGL